MPTSGPDSDGSLRTQVENTGVQLIRQASAKTNDVAGDGTTSGAEVLPGASLLSAVNLRTNIP